jgi:hypothetical protein
MTDKVHTSARANGRGDTADREEDERRDATYFQLMTL